MAEDRNEIKAFVGAESGDAEQPEVKRSKTNGAAQDDPQEPEASDEKLNIPLQTLSQKARKEFMESHWLVTIGNKVAVAYWGKDDVGDDELRTLGTADFSKFYADKQVMYHHKHKVELGIGRSEWKTTSKTHPLAEYFLKKAQRLNGLTMTTINEPVVGSRLNLWRGFGVKPKEGSWKRIKKHIFEVLADGNEAVDEYIIKWIAWALQNPTKPAEVVVVFIGGQGTGKGMICRLVKSLFGIHGLQVFDKDDLIGKFTKHLAWCCFLFADEAFLRVIRRSRAS